MAGSFTETLVPSGFMTPDVGLKVMPPLPKSTRAICELVRWQATKAKLDYVDLIPDAAARFGGELLTFEIRQNSIEIRNLGSLEVPDELQRNKILKAGERAYMI